MTQHRVNHAGERIARGIPRVALVGTYPPTRCGIATFTASLAAAIATVQPQCEIGVVTCVDEADESRHPSEVVAKLVRGSAVSRRRAAKALSGFDVVLLQHEFGIFGGRDGDEALRLVRDLAPPTIAVLHTVSRLPTHGQRRVLEKLCGLAERVVTQSQVARTRLLEQYVVDEQKVEMIPHGARANPSFARSRLLGREEPAVMLTWGLLGPDKGIECGIDAVAQLRARGIELRYRIVGQTHPRILEAHGEQYRATLEALSSDLGVDDLVEFDNAYHDSHSLLAQVRDADLVLLPYRSREQVVSGVLVEAVASGKPVVATAFPHAQELLGSGAGLLVRHDDGAAIAEALERLVNEEGLAARAAAAARHQASSLVWEAVAAEYLELMVDVARPAEARIRFVELPEVSFAHLLHLSDGVGIVEHADGTAPRLECGYCTDDVARALVALMREPRRSAELEALAERCLCFLEEARLPDGRFHNRRSVGGSWEDEVGSDDAVGRALWALGVTAALASTSEQRRRARALFESASGFRTRSPRANAYAVLGAVEVLAIPAERPPTHAYALLEDAADGLGVVSGDPGWPWPEQRLAYANARLAEARIAAGAAIDDELLLNEGIELLAWLVSVERRGDHFSFTPCAGWAPGEARPAFDQQPIEAAAMVDACARAFDVTGEPEWRDAALQAAAWFLGRNDRGVPLLDRSSGGCRDALTPHGTNANEGAESTIASITALQQARRLQAARRSADRTSASSTAAAPIHRSAAP